MLTYANDSLTYWLPDKLKTINSFGKHFHDWVCHVLLKMYKSMLDFTDFAIYPCLNLKLSILKHVDDV